jgi:hypothetical protein
MNETRNAAVGDALRRRLPRAQRPVVRLLLLGLCAGHARCAETGPSNDLPGLKNPDAIQRVVAGVEKRATVTWWGFDSSDATEAVQAAINSGASTVIVPYVGRPWIVRPIQLVSNQTIVLEPGVILQAKKGEFRGKRDCLLMGERVENLTIRGYGATLRMWREEYAGSGYTPSEWRHCLYFRGATNVTILGLRAERSGGDGMAFGPTYDEERRPCRSILVRDCVCDQNYRQGMSVSTVDGMRIANCVFSNTDGTRPKAGLDLEPDNSRDLLANIVVEDCVAEGNRGSGFAVQLSRLTAESRPVSVLFERCQVRSSYGPSLRAHVGQGLRGSVEFRNCVCLQTTYPGLFVQWNKPSQTMLRFVECRWDHVALRRTQRPLELDLVPAAGPVEFVDCHVFDQRPRPLLQLKAGEATEVVLNVQGNIRLISEHDAGLEPAARRRLRGLTIEHIAR